jgi:Uma2 family endonuclease
MLQKERLFIDFFEVVSENYEHYDYFIKLRTYEKFGVFEYNIVNQYGNIIQYILKDGKYVVNKSFHKDEIYKSVMFSDLEIDLKLVFSE